MKRYENRKLIFAKMVLSYILILSIPLITGSIIYFVSVRIVTDDAKQKNLLMLEQVRDVLDTGLNEVEAVSDQIALYDKVITVLNTGQIKEGSAEYFKVWELCKGMPKYKLTNKMILDFYIFLRNSNITISSGNAFCDTNFLYGNAFKYENYNYRDWMNKLWDNYHNREYYASSQVTVNGQKRRVITYMQSIPCGSGSKFQGVITILLNESAIKRLLDRIDVGNTGLVYISDSNGRIITYKQGRDCKIRPSDIQGSSLLENYSRTRSGDKVVLSSTVSGFNKWSFVSVVPEQVVMSKVNYIRSITLVLMLITLLCGIIAAFLMTYRKSKILGNIITRISELFGAEEDRNKNEYCYLEKAVSKLINNNIILQNKMKEQEPLLEAAFLRRLLYGEYYGLSEEDIFQSYTHVDIQDKYITVLIMRIEDYGNSVTSQVLLEYDMIRLLVKECLKLYVNQKYYLLDVDEKSIAVLMAFDYEDPFECKAAVKIMADRVYQEVMEQYSIRLFFAIGDFHKGISGVNTAFMEANNVLDYKKYEKQSRVIWYESIPLESEVYYYPIDLELRLVSLVKSGDIEQVKCILRDIYYENFEKRELSASMIEQLVYAMKGTIIRGLGRMSFDNNVRMSIEALDNARTIDEIFNCVIRANMEICRIMDEQGKKKQEDLIDAMLNYLNRMYHQSDFTLHRLAADFEMTESYAYQFFKDNIGITFADYLENIRIQKACQFLKEEGIPVKNIADQVGYNSDNSFRRAFKRVMGVSPSDYANAVK